MEYFIIGTASSSDYCEIWDFPPDLDKKAPAATGGTYGDDWPAGQVFTMSDEAPGIQVADFIHNLLRYLMVSAEAKAVLEQSCGSGVEFLRFTLHDHKGRVARDDCYIVNPLGVQDCVDMDRSEGRLIEKGSKQGQFRPLMKLHLDQQRVPVDPPLFRIAARPNVIVVRSDLRAALESAGLVGAEYTPMGESVRL